MGVDIGENVEINIDIFNCCSHVIQYYEQHFLPINCFRLTGILQTAIDVFNCVHVCHIFKYYKT